MSVSAIVKDGKLVETASQTSTAKAAEATNANGYDKDAFMQLLVAQMKYQDPLEPTSNTEYISQYATFSQVEQLENMASTMELGRASNMVGQTVHVETTDKNGDTQVVEGVVEYVKYESGNAYVSIDGSLYSASDVTAVIDPTYSSAVDIAEAFASSINNLPSIANLTLADKDTIETLRSGFNAMSAYQQSFIDDSYIELLEEYVAKMEQMVADQNALKEKQEAEAEKTAAEGAPNDELSDEQLDALTQDNEEQTGEVSEA